MELTASSYDNYLFLNDLILLFYDMDTNKILKIVETVIGILGTLIALVRRSFPELDNSPEE